MRKTFLTITVLALVPLGTAACVSKSEYTKAVESAEVRYNALEAQNARLKGDLARFVPAPLIDRLLADRTRPTRRR
jgi:hypothetical protein